MLKGVAWYTERSISEISLGGLLILVVIRTIQYNMFKMRVSDTHRRVRYTRQRAKPSHFFVVIVGQVPPHQLSSSLGQHVRSVQIVASICQSEVAESVRDAR